MAKEITNTLGKIDIAEDVIATVAGIAATECYGLVGMASRKLMKDGIAELLRRENIRKGVEVIIQNEEVTINLYIIVGYGIKISEVAASVMEKVKYAVESTVGIQVNRVNVYVQGVRVNNV